MSSFQIAADGKVEQIGLAGDGSDNDLKIMEAANGLPIRDTFVIQMFKSLGLNDRTLIEIENDLRSQH